MADLTKEKAQKIWDKARNEDLLYYLTEYTNPDDEGLTDTDIGDAWKSVIDGIDNFYRALEDAGVDLDED